MGPLQRRVLDALAAEGGWLMATELDLDLLRDNDARARTVSLYRAIAALKRRGLVRTGYAFVDPANMGLFVWLPDAQPPALRSPQPRRWRGQDNAILNVLRRITREDVEAWLATGRGVRGYPRDHPVRRQRRADEPPLVPYQLAVERIVAALGGRDEKGRLMPSTSRAIRHALQRLAQNQSIVLHATERGRRNYSTLQCLS